MGLLRVSGSIDVNQFWPKGQSDADTTKVVLDVGPDAFRFGDSPARLKPVAIFDSASLLVPGQGRKEVVQTMADGSRKVTIRLQGIDAPELHYRAQEAPRKGAVPDNVHAAFFVEYRQPLGERAAFEFGSFLATLAPAGTLDCEVDTFVEQPNDVFDVYARLVGEIFVNVNGRRTNLNHWVVENGWAVPGLYSSMSKPELEAVLAAWDKARTGGKGIAPHLSKKASPADVKLTFRPKGSLPGGNPNIGGDTGPVIIPKAFRRLVTFTVKQKHGLLDAGVASFHAYLAKKPDPYLPTFLALNLADDVRRSIQPGNPLCVPFHTKVTAQGEVEVQAKDMVFLEKSTDLQDANGKSITSWAGRGGSKPAKKPAPQKPAKKPAAKKAPAKKAPAKKKSKKK